MRRRILAVSLVVLGAVIAGCSDRSVPTNPTTSPLSGVRATSNLQSHIDNVTKWTLGQLTNGGILDPDGTGPLNPTSGCVKMLGLIFTFANAFPTTLPPLPGGFNAGWSIFNP